MNRRRVIVKKLYQYVPHVDRRNKLYLVSSHAAHVSLLKEMIPFLNLNTNKNTKFELHVEPTISTSELKGLLQFL